MSIRFLCRQGEGDIDFAFDKELVGVPYRLGVIHFGEDPVPEIRGCNEGTEEHAKPYEGEHEDDGQKTVLTFP